MRKVHEGSEAARGKNSEVARWEAPGFIRGWGTKLYCIASGK